MGYKGLLVITGDYLELLGATRSTGDYLGQLEATRDHWGISGNSIWEYWGLLETTRGWGVLGAIRDWSELLEINSEQ